MLSLRTSLRRIGKRTTSSPRIIISPNGSNSLLPSISILCTSHHHTHHQTTILPSTSIQTRSFAGRKDRASTAYETRKPTRKQLKTYHRRRRAQDYEKNKHSKPNSKAMLRRLEDKENTQRLIEIAQEEEVLKGQLSAYYDKVNEIQTKIEGNPKFTTLLQEGRVSSTDMKRAARDAAKKAANKSNTPHPPLPSWIQDRMTYDWGDALIDDLMGNSADLTSSASPYPVYMGGEYGRLRRKVERMLRGQKMEERYNLLDDGGAAAAVATQNGMAAGSSNGSSGLPLDEAAATKQSDLLLPDIQRSPNQEVVSDKLLSDLIRAHRDVNGKRTTPLGLAQSLQLIQELQIPLSTLSTYSYVSLLTCCKSPWEGRKINELRKGHGVRSNEYFWSALVDVYARSGDYRGAEQVLDEMLEESQMEYDDNSHTYRKNDRVGDEKVRAKPIAIPPLPAYTSFFSSCYKLITRGDVHPSIKSDAADRAWKRWKEMRINGVPPDVMAYGALMRIFAAQGRPEQAIDLLDEIMMQMMMPVSADGVLGGSGNKDGQQQEEVLHSIEGDGDGWYDDAKGETVRVKPTTLLFTSALKAVAKSHEIATKFNGGNSKKNRRRESITSYHGRLTRKIVVTAEQAEVRQDDGFVSALMLCAAAAGDSSTARAIYLASKVRRLDHLRTCGGKDHLNRLQGLISEDEKEKLLGGGGGDSEVVSTSSTLSGTGSGASKAPALRSIEEEFVEEHEAYEHREYGSDTRILSTLMLAHAKAMEPKGLGSMWAGKYNRGYLCHNSLRYMEAYNIPQMENMAIPGLDSVQAGLSPEGWEAEDFDDGSGKTSKALRKKNKFNIKQIMDDGSGNRKDDQESFFDGFDPDDSEDWRLQLRRDENEGGATKREQEVTRDWLSNQLGTAALPSGPDDGDTTTVSYKPNQTAEVDGGVPEVIKSNSDYSNDFDSDSDDDDDDSDDEEEQRTPHDSFLRKQLQQSQQAGTDREALVKAMAEVTNDLQLAEDLIPKDLDLMDDEDEDGDFDPGSYFDEEAFSKLMDDTERGMDDSKGGDAEELKSIPGIASNDFAAFTAHLKQELISEGSTSNVDETEARQLFDMMRTYFDEGSSSGDEFLDDNSEIISSEHTASNQTETSFGDMIDSSSFASMDMARSQLDSLKNDDTLNIQHDGTTAQPQMQRISTNSMGSVAANETIYADDYLEWANSQTETLGVINEVVTSENELSEVEQPSATMDVPLPRQYTSPLVQDDEEPHIKELQEHLPGLPMNRIEKVSDEFARTLAYPSILRLTVAVRENMPEAFSPQCLTRVNLANAKHVMSVAEEEGLVDAHLLNGMLRVYTNSGRIEPALRFYDTEYEKHGLTPTTHSDRLLLQMLVQKRRIARAFKLKQDIERDGRSLDILSYGTLIEYYGKHKQLGSALMLIKECIDKHGTAPGEKSLKNIRLICRQNNLIEQVGLEKLVGEDPLEWMRRGEELKRVQNKRAKSAGLLFGMNRMLDI